MCKIYYFGVFERGGGEEIVVWGVGNECDDVNNPGNAEGAGRGVLKGRKEVVEGDRAEKMDGVDVIGVDEVGWFGGVKNGVEGVFVLNGDGSDGGEWVWSVGC